MNPRMANTTLANILACVMLGVGCTPNAGPPATNGGAAEGKACGSRGLGPCADNEFCVYPTTAACGDADAPGRCTIMPTMCTREYMPVCGCDGKTYSTACTAHASGVAVRSGGACADDSAGDATPAEEAAPEAPPT